MRKSLKWIYQILYTVVFTAIYYAIFSYSFDTPIEHELKKSTQQLVDRYQALNSKFDSLVQVANNIEQRDMSIFEIIFEAKPYENPVMSSRSQNQEQLQLLDNRELSEIFDTRLSTLTSSITTQSNFIDWQLGYIDSLSDRINAIPSIQPIDNQELNLLAASYGYRIHPFYKQRHFHKGLDYAVPVGTAVFATADGRVSSIETRGQSSGLSILLDHDGRFSTFYANLDKVLVRPGARVVRGDIIAFTGNSGLSYAPHLHYEVRVNGVQVDPLQYFFAELDIFSFEQLQRIASVAMQSFD